jgi:hypothetical protein
MKILTAVEQDQFESPPVFNSVQRKQYFDFSSELLILAQGLQTPTNQVCFLVSCGYFKAAKRFFPNRQCSRRDLDYVAQQLGFQPESIDVNSYSATTRLRHERLILDFYGFRPFDSTAKSLAAGEIEKMARSQLQPALILWRIVDILVKEKIEIPGYYPLAELILGAVNTRKAELCAIIERAITARTREAFDELLVQGNAGEDEPVPAKTAAYKLTLLKKLSQSTKPSKIKETITDLQVVQGLYRDFMPILSALELNHEGIRYYANSVIKSEIFQVTRRSSEDRYLHLIAFITHQYFRLQDNLLDVLLNVLQTYLNIVQREHKEVCYRRREHWNEAVRKLIGYLDHSVLKILSVIKEITDSAELDDAGKVRQIRALLEAEEPDRHQTEASLAPLKRDLEKRDRR